jgi:hypothetical protein
MIASAKSAVSIRRIDDGSTSTEPSAALSRAEAALAQGDLAAAIKEIESLPGPDRDAFAGWLDDAHARASVKDTLNRLENVVLASLAPAPQVRP